MSSPDKQGFTLIELLFVISIVSLLSSIVLTAMGVAREKGRIGAGIQFEANIYHGIGSETTGIFPMEEGSGSSVADFSGGSAGVLSGTPTWSSSTYHWATKQALVFDGSTNYLTLANCSVSKRLNGAPGITSTRWVYLNALPTPGNTFVVDFLNTGLGGGGNALGINSNGTVNIQGRSVSTDTLQSANGTTPLSLNKWYQVTASTDFVNKTFTLYIDGRLDTKATGLGFANSSFTQTSCSSQADVIGASPTPDRYFNGRIDNARYYGAAL